MKLPDGVYDVLKWIAIVAIPALVTFLSIILPALKVSPEVVNTVTTIISALGVFIGTLLGVSTYAYKKQNEPEDE